MPIDGHFFPNCFYWTSFKAIYKQEENTACWTRFSIFPSRKEKLYDRVWHTILSIALENFSSSLQGECVYARHSLYNSCLQGWINDPIGLRMCGWRTNWQYQGSLFVPTLEVLEITLLDSEVWNRFVKIFSLFLGVLYFETGFLYPASPRVPSLSIVEYFVY